MGTGIGLTLAVLVLVAVTVLFIRLWVGYRGKRIVTCPETQLPVGAQINAPLAAGTWIVSQPRFVISGCSRWPEREGCDQACVPQIEDAPDETLVKNIVAKWYQGKDCIYCGSSIREINGSAVAPALRGIDGELHEWKDVAPEDLPALLETSVAVCERCELAEDFRRRFPNLVVDRADTPLRNRAIH